MNTKYNGTLDIGKSKLFQYEVPKEGITVLVQVTEGKLLLYGSHSNPDPSRVWHDYMLSDIHGDRKVIIPYPTAAAQRKQDAPVILFYCNLVGMEKSAFSIKAVSGTV